MMKKFTKYVAGLFAILMLGGAIAPPIAYADEIHYQMNNISKVTTSSSDDYSYLFDEIMTRHPELEVVSFTDENFYIIQLLDEHQNIVAAEIINTNTGEFTTVTSITGEVTLENGEFVEGSPHTDVIEYHQIIYANQDELTFGNSTQNYWNRGPWQYTGIAVGKDIFSTTFQMAYGALLTFVAAIFGIPVNLASFLFNYMGVKGLTGSSLGDHFDTNRNGWIELYKRPINLNQTIWEHRTF